MADHAWHVFGPWATYNEDDLSDAGTIQDEGTELAANALELESPLIHPGPSDAKEVAELLKGSVNIDRFSAFANVRTGEVTVQWRSVLVSVNGLHAVSDFLYLAHGAFSR